MSLFLKNYQYLKQRMLSLLALVQRIEEQNRKEVAKTLLYTSLVVTVLVQMSGSSIDPKFWYITRSACMLTGIYLSFSIYNNLFLLIMLQLSINDLLDEVFFNPLAIDINEYLTALFIVFLTTRKKLVIMYRYLRLKYKKDNETRIL